MFQVSIDPVASSAASNVRPSARSDQTTDDSDDFASLVDSSTNAAAVSSAQSAPSYDRASSAQNTQTTSQNDTGASQQTRARAPSRDDHGSSDHRTASHPSAHAAKSASADKEVRTRGKPDKGKNDKRDDNTNSQNAVSNTDAANASANVNGAVATQAVAANNNAQPAADSKNGTADEFAGKVEAAAGDAGQVGASPHEKNDVQGQPTDSIPKGPADVTGTTPGPAAVGTIPLTTGVLPAALPVQNGNAADVKAATPSAAKPVSVQAAAKLADAKASGNQAQTTQPTGDGSGAAATANGDGDVSQSKTTSSIKADAAQIAAPAQHDHSAAGAQSQQPDANFQSILNLQAPQQAPQATSGNFNVLNAGRTGSVQASSAPVPVNGVAADIASKASAGNTSFTIRLDPADLGQIDVRLDVDKHGQVTSHLTVEHPATLDMLRNDAPKLQQALENAGLKTGDGGMQFSLRDQSSQHRSDQGGQNQNQSQNSQRLIISEDVPVARVAGGSYSRSRGSSTGVDISI